MGKAAIFIIVFGGMAAWLVFWFLKGETFLLPLMTEAAKEQYQQRNLGTRFQTILRTKPRFSRLTEAGWKVGIMDPLPPDQPFSFQLQKEDLLWVLTDCQLIPRGRGARCEGITKSSTNNAIAKPYQIPILVATEDTTTVELPFSRHGLVSMNREAEMKWKSLTLEAQLNLVETRLGAFDTLAQNGWHIAINDLRKGPTSLHTLFSMEKNLLSLSECRFQESGKEVACNQIKRGNRRVSLPIHLTDLKKETLSTPWQRQFTAFLEPEAKARFKSFESHLQLWFMGAYLPQLKKMALTWNPKVTGFDEKKGMIIADLTLGSAQLTTCLLDVTHATKTAQCEGLRYRGPGTGGTVEREVQVPLMLSNLNKGQAVSRPHTILRLEGLGSSRLSGTLIMDDQNIRVENPQLKLLSPQASPPQKAVLDLEPFSLNKSRQVQSKQPWTFNWLSQWDAYVRDYLEYKGPAAQLAVVLVVDLATQERGFSLQGSGSFFGKQAVPVQGNYRPGETLAMNLEKLQFSSRSGEVCARLEPAWVEQDLAASRLRVMGTATVEDKNDLFCESQPNQRSAFAERFGKKLLYGTLLKKARRELSTDKTLSLGVHLLFDPGEEVFCSRIAARGKAMLDITMGNAVPFQMKAPYQWQTQDSNWQASSDTIKSFVKHALAKGMRFPEVRFHLSHDRDPGPATQDWRLAVPPHTYGPAQ